MAGTQGNSAVGGPAPVIMSGATGATGAAPPTPKYLTPAYQQFASGTQTYGQGGMSGQDAVNAQATGMQGGISPTQVSVDPNILNSMGNYQNAALANQTRELDPQWQQAQNQFDQQMVSQGLTPGSVGYNNAYQQFMQGKNDAYTSAYNNSFQTGLAAQGQAFNQGLSQSQLANALAVAGINKAATTGAAGISANASMHNADESNATNQLLGLGNLGLGYGQLQNQNSQMDLQNLLGISGLSNGATQYNNNLVGGAQNTLLGLIPNSSPTPVDVTGAYGMNQAGQNAAYQGNVASSNATNQTAGELGSAALMMMMMSCDREVKDDHGAADTAATLKAVNSLPLHRWNYKGETQTHIGTFAQEFNAELGLPEAKTIHIIDMLGALIGSVQALTKRVEAMEAA